MSPRRCFLCNKIGSNLTFHRFPKAKALCRLWKDVCNLKEHDSVTSLFICSDHFSNDDYSEPRAREIGGLLRLKPNRYPTVNVPNPDVRFNTSLHTIMDTTNELQLVREHIDLSPDSGPSTSQYDEDPRTPKRRKCHEPKYLGDVTTPDVATPKKAKIVV